MIELRFSDYLEDHELGKDLDYLKSLHQLSCCVCDRYGLIQTSRTTAHHVICGRYGHLKTPDRMAIPICLCHHQGMHMGRDISKLAIHNGKAPWEAEYGPDYGYIEETQERVELLAA